MVLFKANLQLDIFMDWTHYEGRHKWHCWLGSPGIAVCISIGLALALTGKPAISLAKLNHCHTTGCWLANCTGTLVDLHTESVCAGLLLHKSASPCFRFYCRIDISQRVQSFRCFSRVSTICCPAARILGPGRLAFGFVTVSLFDECV